MAVTCGAIRGADTGAATYSLIVALALFLLLWHGDQDACSLDARRNDAGR